MSPMMTRAAAALVLAAVAAACASTRKPDTLVQAEQIYESLERQGVSDGVEADMIRARAAILRAQTAVTQRNAQEYTDGVSYVALRNVQAAEAEERRRRADRGADSLRTARLNRLLSMTEAQRSALAAQQQLSQAEIAALRDRNMMVSQQADSLRMRNVMVSQQADSLRMRNVMVSQQADSLRLTTAQLQQRNDSLRREAEAANARLNSALTQLRSLVTEITNLRETTRGIVISLSDILFDVNRATLRGGSEAKLRQVATILNQYPDRQISVEGHTDATGSDSYNQRLSEERAASVRATLVSGGVNADAIISKGFGKSQPVATNNTAEGRQQNRRVEIIVLGAGTVADAARNDSIRAAPPQR